MKKLYERSELAFSLVWIGLYVIVMNIALKFCGGFDDLAGKTAEQVMIPVICICVLAVVSTVWIIGNGLSEKYGLCRFKGNRSQFLHFIPLILMSCVNLINGLGLNAPAAVALLMMVNLAAAGYVEEIIFRGFLFRCLAKDDLRSAIIVSAVTFGAGHIVNLANTADTLGVLLQVCYAIVIGFLYTIIVYKGGSLWPCIASHMFVNGSSTFALEQGPFSDFVAAVFGQTSAGLVQVEVNRFMPYNLYTCVEQAVEWLCSVEQCENEYHFGFVRKSDGLLVGAGSIGPHEERTAETNLPGAWEFGYNLRRDCWNMGYATEATRAMIDFAHRTFGVKDFCANHAIENPASGRVMEKVGCTFHHFSKYSTFDGTQTFPSKVWAMHLED